MKNIAHPLLIAILLTPLIGVGQEYGSVVSSPPPVYFCEDGDLEKCKTTDPTTGTILNEVPNATAVLGWEELPEARADPKSDLPGNCSSKQEYAIASWNRSINTFNHNKFIENYDWRGVSSEGAEALIERLLAINPLGHWEKSIVVEWNGMEEDQKRIPKHLRWTDENGESTYFTMRKAEGCWFFAFTSPAVEVIQIEGAPALGAPSSTVNNISNENDSSSPNFIIVN